MKIANVMIPMTNNKYGMMMHLLVMSCPGRRVSLLYSVQRPGVEVLLCAEGQSGFQPYKSSPIKLAYPRAP